MPLTICLRDKSGKLVTDPETGWAKNVSIPMPNEMAERDFGIIADENFSLYDMRHMCLDSNFEDPFLNVPEVENYNDSKRKLAAFLIENMTGPYYVFEGVHNTRETLHVTILEASDRETFARQYPHWQRKEDGVIKTATTLAFWRAQGRQLANPEIYKYAAPHPVP